MGGHRPSRGAFLLRLRRILALRGRASIHMEGRSMEPTFRAGEPVILTAARRAKVGDVAFIVGPRGPVFHRIMGWVGSGRRRWLVHLADASSFPGVAAEEEIVGCLTRPRRRSGPAWRAHAFLPAVRLGALLSRVGASGLRQPARVIRRVLFL